MWLGEVASVTYINTFVRWSVGSRPAPSPVPCVMHCWRQLHHSASIVTCREARGGRPLRFFRLCVGDERVCYKNEHRLRWTLMLTPSPELQPCDFSQGVRTSRTPCEISHADPACEISCAPVLLSYSKLQQIAVICSNLL